MLRARFFSAEQVAAIVRDYRNAGLAPKEVAFMAFAEKLTQHADQITADNVDGLRAHGLTDEEILDVALAAAARNFYSKLLDALGTEPPGAAEMKVDEHLHGVLTTRGE